MVTCPPAGGILHGVVQDVPQGFGGPLGVVADGDGVVAVDGKGDSLGLPLAQTAPTALARVSLRGLSSKWRAKVPVSSRDILMREARRNSSLSTCPTMRARNSSRFSGERGCCRRMPRNICRLAKGVFYLVGDVTHQFLDGLLVLCALALAVGHLLIVLEKLALDLGGDGVLIGLYGGKAFPSMRASTVSQMSLARSPSAAATGLPAKPPGPPPPKPKASSPPLKQGKGQSLPHHGPQADEATQGHHGGPQPRAMAWALMLPLPSRCSPYPERF